MSSLIGMIADVAMFESALAFAVTYLRRFGDTGHRLANASVKAPMLDLVIGLFTWIPWVILGLAYGWRGVICAIAGQVIALYVWISGHEMIHRDFANGPRIVKVLNRIVGRWQNHLALWVMAIALPGFLILRLLQLALWPGLVALLRFPRYDQARWISVSRHNFVGLVGHDLIWGLYFDWMTGVYSLGAEMLRNAASFWCPIRFEDGRKCDNCKRDFPDINNGWVHTDGNMQQVVETLQGMYGNTSTRSWFGHASRGGVGGR